MKAAITSSGLVFRKFIDNNGFIIHLLLILIRCSRVIFYIFGVYKLNMKKIISFLLVHFFLFISSCFCPDEGSITYITIQTARGLLYSFDENGIFPYLDHINRHELGLSIMEDSTSENIEYVQSNMMINQLQACQDPHEIKYINGIDSINIFTIYNFDSDHLASSKVNDILRPINTMGELLDIENITTLNFTMQHLKFIKSPTFDTLQFEITGRIIGSSNFSILTNKIILQ